MGLQIRQLNRRHFLEWVSTAGACLAIDHHTAGTEAKAEALASAAGENGARLRQLELLSSVPLARMREFYKGLLGLRVIEDTPERLTISAGQTRLTFLAPTAEHTKPFYHFAFNIPENKVLAAHRWQKERTPLLPIPKALRAAEYADEVVNYSHWNAHSIFFFDPSGNVVEYIARHDLRNAAPGEFGSSDILYASEIAFVVDDVTATTAKLKQVVGVGQYRGASDQFAAVGDELGLLLVMKRGRVISFEAPEKKAVNVFPTTAAVRGERRTNYLFADFPYEVAVEG